MYAYTCVEVQRLNQSLRVLDRRRRWEGGQGFIELPGRSNAVAADRLLTGLCYTMI